MTEQTVEYLRKAKAGDKQAAETLIEENSGLIWSVARRFFGRGTEADDLYQLGCVGFLKAIEGFDESFGTQFSTYAVPKISGEIRRFLRDDGSVKVSRSIKEQAQKIKSVRTELEQRFGREPLLSEISAETGLTPEEIAFAETATGPAESLQRETGEDGFTLEHVLTDLNGEERMIEQVSLRYAIEQLPEKEKKTIYLRYFHGMTQESASRVLGVSQVQVSRLERRAVDKLREVLTV
ncbi:MAG: sigma-70 family RNA polymerase sigma factor [Oscillospiraceae bacterium]|nr:sigma-70 family RNA polymerase sigma factor [Oscillospiraceae bacterium]